MLPRTPPLQWDIFCRVIDNLGDVGVCWRLSHDLATRGQRVRLWMDQPEALQWMAPGALEGEVAGVTVRHWPQVHTSRNDWQALSRADVWIEAFGCEPPDAYIEAQRRQWPDGTMPVWVNLEYLSAEPYVERMHRLPSPLMQGPGRGWTRWFFYPGFTTATGGLLREPGLEAQQAAFDRNAWRAQWAAGLAAAPWISLFCYEPAGLPWLLNQCMDRLSGTLLLTPGRAQAAAMSELGGSAPPAHWVCLPWVPQPAFDRMLWACDLNAVRGEDSLVRALWAGQALVWQIYPQDDHAHHDKLNAFLDWLDAPPDLRAFHHFWNGMGGQPPDCLSAGRLRDWAAVTQQARARLYTQADLVSQLLSFVMEKR